jgi:hypothetical protein
VTPPSDARAAKYAYQKEWRDRNREKLRAKRKAKYAREKEQERARQRTYYAENGDRLRARARARARERRTEMLAYNKEWVARDRIRNRLRYLVRSCRLRAQKKGLEFAITVADLTIPDRCPMLGIPIDLSPGFPVPPGAPSIDRIDNALGYVPGNVRVISYRANSLKRDMTLEEAKMLVENWAAR